ncbi:hypothetical protein TWF751_011631 [Orbilia oligospora]|nr:hypothetical protein TWF751_011631 [Orbilia oligospora]KAF3265275.1 hypothetical protein TWF128_000556 [Orbilia oligospora]
MERYPVCHVRESAEGVQNEEKDSIEEIHSLLQYCMETLEHSESSVIFRNLAVIFQLEFRCMVAPHGFLVLAKTAGKNDTPISHTTKFYMANFCS